MKKKLKNLFFKEIPLDRLTGFCGSGGGGDELLKRVHFSDSSSSPPCLLNQNTPSSMDFLRVELNHREDIINSLQQELKVLRNQYESLLNGVSRV